jgi:hypothetical protein
MASSIFLIALLLAAVFSISLTAAHAQGGGMTAPTSKGTLDIRVEPTWMDGGQAKFKISFLNPGTETLHEHQDYDVRILKGDQEVFSAAKQIGQALIHNVGGTINVPGTGFYTFQQNGDYTIQVHLAGTGIAPTLPTDEDATFPIKVTPEFPPAALGGIVAALMTTAIVLARYHRLL